MAEQIKDVLHNTVTVEVAYDNQRDFVYPARIKLIMNSELDLALISDQLQKVPFQKGDRLFVTLKTRECCYNFTTLCTYTKQTNLFYLSVQVPVRLTRAQYREFIRAPFTKEIQFFITSDGLCKPQMDTVSVVTPQDMKIHLLQAESIDISAGGIAFYTTQQLKKMANIIVDLSTIIPDAQEMRQHATIVRCHADDKGKSAKWRAAAHFVNMPFAVQEKLNHFVFDLIREQAKQQKDLL